MIELDSTSEMGRMARRRRACNHVAVQCHLGIDGGWVLESDRDWLAALVIFRGLGVDPVASFL